MHHIKFELTPAIWHSDKTYKIPNNANCYLDWLQTKPFYLDELASQQQELRYKQVTRLLKYWNCLNDKYCASYKLEERVFNSGIYCYADNLQQNLFQVLKNISPYGEPIYVQNYIQKTKDIIKYIEDNEKYKPIDCETKIKTLFKELK